MPRFIKLTGHKQGDVWVNPDKINTIKDCSEGGKFLDLDYRTIVLDHSYCEVKNSVEEIIHLCQNPRRL